MSQLHAVRRAGPGLALALLFAGGLPARAVPPGLAELQNAISSVAERVKPSVVSLTVEVQAAQSPAPVPLPGPGGPRFGVSRGSGMVFRETPEYYYILTNAHVVRHARDRKVEVKLVDNRERREGVVLGTDRRSDTAVVRMDRRQGEHLPVVTFGNIEALRVGTLVLAVGSPFDFEATVTLGIVSGLDKTIREPEDGQDPGVQPQVYDHLVQTDASINPGNSGGPLVNLDGEVIGINFAIFSPGATAGNIGIGFAIPIDTALRVVDDLIEKGHAVRGYLGVNIIDLTAMAEGQGATPDDVRRLYGVDSGAYVQEVVPDTPAARASLQPGDVVVSFNGQSVGGSGELVEKVGRTDPGVEVGLEVVRDGKRLSLRVTLDEMPPEVTGDQWPGQPPSPTQLARDPLGLKVEAMTEGQMRDLGLARRGVLVTDVEPESLALRLGLGPGTVLLGGRRPEQEPVEFEAPEAYHEFIAAAAEQGELVQLDVSLPQPGGKRVERSMGVKVPKMERGDPE